MRTATPDTRPRATAAAAAAPAAALAAAAFACAWASVGFTRHGGQGAAVWPLNALLLVVLLRAWGDRGRIAFAAAAMAGDVAAHLAAGDPAAVSLIFPAVNVAQVLLVGAALRRRSRGARGGGGPDLARAADLLAFAGAAVLAGPAASATLAAAVRAATGWGGGPSGAAWLTWFLADALGMTVVGLPLLAVRPGEGRALLRPRAALRAGGPVLLAVAVALAVFAQGRYPLPFAVFPPLVLAAFAGGAAAAAAATLLVALVATALTVAGHGPLASIPASSPGERLLLLQLFLLAAVLVAVPLAAALAGRERLARSAARARRRLDDALETMGDGLALHDADGRLVLCNGAFLRLHPLSAHLWVPGALLADIWREEARLGVYAGGPRPDAAPAEVEAWIAARRARRDVDDHEELALAGGRWLQVRRSATSDGGLIVVARDVTHHRRNGLAVAEANRRVAEAGRRLDDALAGMADGLALFDADERLVLRNRRYLALFPRSAGLRVPGARAEDLAREAARRGEYAGVGVGDTVGAEAWVARKLALFRAGEPQELELADGRWVESVASRTGAGGSVVAYRDVTERKRLERDLGERNARLEAMNAELDQFASMAAHDLRAPLRQAGVLAGWVAEELGEGCPEVVRGHLGQMRARLRRMGRLVEGLRQYAHAGGREMPAAELDTGALAAEAAELACAPPGLRVEVEPGLPAVVAPEPALALVLRNLVGNAVKHHDLPGGAGRVLVRRAEARPGEVGLVVEDDGPGVPEDLRERAFDLFARFRGDDAEPGGVGLALVRRTLAVHGGRAWIGPSALGRGTAVHVAWPGPATVELAA